MPSVSQCEAAPPPRLESTTKTFYLTRLGRHKQITLPDGSRVDLTSDSRISAAFPREGRSIEQELWNRPRAAMGFPSLIRNHV